MMTLKLGRTREGGVAERMMGTARKRKTRGKFGKCMERNRMKARIVLVRNTTDD